MTALVITLIVSLGAAVFIGFRYASARKERDRYKALAKGRQQALEAMVKAIEKESELRETFNDIASADDPSELNRLYESIVSRSKDSS